MTHIVGKLDSVLQKVADHRQEVMNNIVVTSPTANDHEQDDNPSPHTATLRKHSGVDSSSIEGVASVAPLRERIQNMRLSVSSLTDNQNNFNSLNRERRRKKSPASSIVESSGEYPASTAGDNPTKETSAV